MKTPIQWWRIQDFLKVLVPTLKLVLFCNFLSKTKTAWKWKNLDSQGAHPPLPLTIALDPPMDCLFDSYSVVDLRCLEGRSLPPGTKFFQFHAVFGKCSKIVCWRLPPRVDAPTSGKSWIHHCYWLFVWISHHEVWASVRVLSVSINFPHCPSLTYSTFDPNWWFGWVSHSSGDLRFIMFPTCRVRFSTRHF